MKINLIFSLLFIISIIVVFFIDGALGVVKYLMCILAAYFFIKTIQITKND